MTDPIILRCNCGQVELQLTGAPIVTASCYCDDCQAGGHKLAELTGVAVVGEDGGTPSVLYRRDRVKWIKGENLLVRHKLRPRSATNRVVASCCNTPMLVDFDRGPHWVSIYRDRFGAAAPATEMLVNTRFRPKDVTLPANIRAYESFPLSFIGRLIASRVAMLFPG
jgi:hypothetical protein